MANFVENCRKSIKALEEHDLHAIVASLGTVYGIKCVGKSEDGSVLCELDTSKGEFPILDGGGFAGIGLLILDMGNDCHVGYLDAKVLAAQSLLKMLKYNHVSREFHIGNGDDAFTGFDMLNEGDWIELRGLEDEDAYEKMNNLKAPSCFDLYEHFCRQVAWLDEEGNVIEDMSRFARCEAKLDLFSESCINAHMSKYRSENYFRDRRNLWETIRRARTEVVIELVNAGLLKRGW